ncbi:MAG: HU family DNA-binding protein [Acidobacteriota bacterium]|jgi:DNA-binding protein HU-beta
MTKTELIKKLGEVTGLPQKDVRAVVDALFNSKPGKGLISTSLKMGQKVTLSGFGTFYIRERSARTARNPRTGSQVKVPSRTYPAFKPAKSFKDAIKSKK